MHETKTNACLIAALESIAHELKYIGMGDKPFDPSLNCCPGMGEVLGKELHNIAEAITNLAEAVRYVADELRQ